jgi:hypothetical protein
MLLLDRWSRDARVTLTALYLGSRLTRGRSTRVCRRDLALLGK